MSCVGLTTSTGSASIVVQTLGNSLNVQAIHMISVSTYLEDCVDFELWTSLKWTRLIRFDVIRQRSAHTGNGTGDTSLRAVCRRRRGRRTAVETTGASSTAEEPSAHR